MADKFYQPKRHSGFSKTKSVKDNVRTMLMNADRRLSSHHKLLQVGRQAQALANATTDKTTQKKAQAVASEAFRRLK